MTEMTKEEIEQRLNKMSEEIFSSGYLAGLKSVLPFVTQINNLTTDLSVKLDSYLKENDSEYGKPMEEIAKELSDNTEELRKLKEDEQTT